MREPTLSELIDTCHHDMVVAGHWDEAQTSAPPDDTWQLALLADLVVAVGALCDRQRKTGTIADGCLDDVAEALWILRDSSARGCIAPYARRGMDGTREKHAVLPSTGFVAHLLRQLLHLHIEVGETIAAYRAGGYRDSDASDEEMADIALVLFDLCGVMPEVLPTIRRKQAINRTRGRQYGRPPTADQTNCVAPLSVAEESATMEEPPMSTDPTPPPADAPPDEEPLAKIHRSRPLAKRRRATDEEETPLGGWADPTPLAKSTGEK